MNLASSGLRRAGLLAALLGSACLTAWAAAAGGQRVLIVSAPNVPLVRSAVEALNRHGQRRLGAGQPALQVDVRVLPANMPFADFAHQLQPTLASYRAVFATSIALARAVQVEAPDLPLVFHGEADPMEFCLVDAMSRPGRSATGYVNYLPRDDEKLVEALVDGFPALRTLYFGVAAGNYYVPTCGPNAVRPPPPPPPCVPGVRQPDAYLERMQETPSLVEQARRLGLTLKFVLFCGPADFAQLAGLARGAQEVGFVMPYRGLFLRAGKLLIEQTALTRRPAIFGAGKQAEQGAVMAMEPIRDADDDRAVIDMLLQVVDGRSPATFPVQVPRGFELTVNAAAAAAQGLQPSLTLLRRADRILVSTAAR